VPISLVSYLYPLCRKYKRYLILYNMTLIKITHWLLVIYMLFYYNLLHYTTMTINILQLPPLYYNPTTYFLNRIYLSNMKPYLKHQLTDLLKRQLLIYKCIKICYTRFTSIILVITHFSQNVFYELLFFIKCK
jgi:hypothetical protein